MSGRSRNAFVVTLALTVASCAGAGKAPAVSAPTEPAAQSASTAPYTRADVAFMQGMIAHHGQALDMAALVPARSGNESLGILAQRIEATQANEIGRMSRWLEARGEAVPDPRAYREHAGHGAGDMPGMLTPAQMDRLAAASGNAFDRLFLEYMIRHHEGALTMVAELQQAGGGNEAEIYLFAADVDAEQRAEIARMRGMLNALQRGSE